MTRPFRQQIDDGILDRAAGLFARRGFAKTSVQDVADAVGLSKAGLLHHFPTKEALHAAVIGQAEGLGVRVLDAVHGLPPGPARDRRAVEVMVDIAFAHPGLVALLLAPVSHGGADAVHGSDVGGTAAAALRAFGLEVGAPVSERSVRVAGALAALAVLSIAAAFDEEPTVWRPHIVATCMDALASDRAGALSPVPDRPEA